LTNVGRDNGNVTPVNGVTLGGGKQTIEVEVYVRPAKTTSTEG